MDEEELEQSNKKITIDNFFESISSVDEVANRALQQSQENFNLVSVNSNLLQGLEESIQLIESDIQQITNYFIVQQDQRRKQLEIREQGLSKRQDISQKQIGDKLQDVVPFESRPRNFGESLLQGAAGLAQDATRPFIGPGLLLGLSGLLGFKDGGEPPVNKPSIVGEEGPEIFVPKTSGTIIPNNVFSTSSSATMERGKVVSGDMSQSDAEKNLRKLELESERFDAIEAHGYNSPEANEARKKLLILSGTPEEAIYTDKKGNLKVKGFSTYGDKTTVSDDKEGKGLFGGLFGGDKKNKNVKSDNKDGRGLLGMIGGSIDAMTGGLTDLDRRGGKPFGLMRGITGMADAMTGNLFDFDRRGKGKSKRKLKGDESPTSTELTREDFKSDEDFEFYQNNFAPLIKEGDEALGEVKSESIKPDQSKTSIGLTREDFKSDEDFEFYQNNFDPFQSIKPDQSKTNELVSQNMLAPPEGEDDVITLPPISGGGDDEPIETTPSPFGSSNSQSDQITGTESGIPFIDVISNPFLSVV